MADVTISSLTPGTPNSSASIPYSDGGVTYQVAPSAVLTNAGNIGIGTATPSSKLHVNGVITHSVGTIGSNANGTRTISTGTPAAGSGSSGDIWYQV
jgi:hypothetical protein